MAPETDSGDESSNAESRPGSCGYQLGHYSGPPVKTWNNELTALVVDGINLCRRLGRDILTIYGVETVTVDSGRAALDLIHSGASFSLIVVDTDMLHMDGVECTRRLRTMGVTSYILGTTPIFSEEEEDAFFAAGGDDLVQKPLTPSKFLPILQELDNQA